ncbi:MAG: hypothetical protein KC422_03900 [Trueperaceae bacterium]|nr:hypothetical protein [Trueperaceae bacterium]
MTDKDTRAKGKDVQVDLDQQDLEQLKEKMHERSMIEVPEVEDRESTHWYYIANEWQELIPNIRETWPELSLDEIKWADANYDRFVAIIERRYGIEPAKAKENVAHWIASLNPAAQA